MAAMLSAYGKSLRVRSILTFAIVVVWVAVASRAWCEKLYVWICVVLQEEARSQAQTCARGKIART